MGIHGFAAGKQYVVQRIEESTVVFQLKDDEPTRVIYPFCFVLSIEYRLENECLNITYTVENKGQRTMYFGIGGHPGFALPFEKGLQFEDYYLKFDEAAALVRVEFSNTCFRTGEAKPFPLNNGRLHLEHCMFDQDAIVLESGARSVVLMSDKGTKAIRVTFPDMPYIGLWHKPRTTAPYICVEPWSSLPSHDGIVEDISQQEDLIKLPAGETYCNRWSIDVIDNIGEKQ
jgi:galactose mutarotase-like enzyme